MGAPSVAAFAEETRRRERTLARVSAVRSLRPDVRSRPDGEELQPGQTFRVGIRLPFKQHNDPIGSNIHIDPDAPGPGTAPGIRRGRLRALAR